MPETVRSRFRKVLAGERPEDRLPVVEWATWWDQTIRRWEGEGLPAGMSKSDIKRYFGQDMDYQFWFGQPDNDAPRPAHHGAPRIATMAEYEAALPHLYPEPFRFDGGEWPRAIAEQAAGDAVIWFTVSGFFWWPRTLLGIEGHLFAFYDQPELMHRINRDQVAFIRRCIDAICAVCTPDFMTFGEDMSYNHGPMIGKDLYDEFMAPYYREIVPLLRERGITVIIDSDGGVEPLIPWFEEVGIEGILPLERMAGVDVTRIRAKHPDWRMIGGYDKTVMHLGEDAVRAEFDRLLPAMRTGGFIPSIDHQTPPGVSLAQYREYLALLWEYAGKACG
jgi:hypothetical protein